jgi:CelD/BcsL family acetyltransferase involved in cellulose biosynthesis
MTPAGPAPDLRVELIRRPDPRALAADWLDLQARADHSYFQSWGWIGTWLACLPPSVEPRCLAARAGGETVGLGLFVARRTRRYRVLPARGLHLHQTGDRRFDQITVEYNGLLLDRRDPAGIAAACLARLDRETDLWNELYLPGVDPAWQSWAAAVGTPDLIQDSRCRYVDLTLGEEAWWGSLSGNVRRQIRRARTLYGEVAVEVAREPAEARAIWAELEQLHQAAWQARGAPGAFANRWFADFHERLIAERMAAGEIQLLRLSGGGRTVACLYNFAYGGRVLSYQSGVALDPDNRKKPGLVAHAAAIAHSRAQGHAVYDFLAGDAQYKRSLARAENRLVWLAVRRPTAAFAVERSLRRLKRSVARLRRRPASANVGIGSG